MRSARGRGWPVGGAPRRIRLITHFKGEVPAFHQLRPVYPVPVAGLPVYIERLHIHVVGAVPDGFYNQRVAVPQRDGSLVKKRATELHARCRVR